MKNILEMVEHSALNYPEKLAFRDSESDITYLQLVAKAKKIGTEIAKSGICGRPVAVIIDRSVKCLTAMLSVLYSGNFYTVIDTEMPDDRVESIFRTLKPDAVICTADLIQKANKCYRGRVFVYEECLNTKTDNMLLYGIRARSVASDPAYVLFTSGSTGVPKGAVLSHASVIAYVKWFVSAFNITSDTVFGSQTPFYFSMSVSDVFATLFTGATLNIIPKQLFSFPMKLLEMLNERKVNTIYWVPSALCIIANWRVLDYGKAEYINKVLFAGEVMPTKQLNYWISKLPDAMFANLFGPTETTDICTYYIVDRHFEDSEPLPIGRHCDNCDVFVVSDSGETATDGEEGELYVRGPFLAHGYYNNREKTEEAFVQNPLNNAYPERVYKTGDLVRYNDKGELIYICRKDFQIKHMGYRIELGEVEAAANGLDFVTACVSLYDAESDSIILIYQGKKQEIPFIRELLAKRLPNYMMPQKIFVIKSMPYNQNGKIDRAFLKNNYKTITGE